MLSTDAMGVYLGVRKGDVVKITRILDDTEYINYRIVIWVKWYLNTYKVNLFY